MTYLRSLEVQIPTEHVIFKGDGVQFDNPLPLLLETSTDHTIIMVLFNSKVNGWVISRIIQVSPYTYNMQCKLENE